MIAPKSDQKNADDFLAGPQTFTITAEVEYDDAQQPAGLVLDGDTAHPYKPGKSMGRVLTAAWGKESYVGRRLTLYTDPSVRFGGQDVGGIRISHMSHITKTLKLNLTKTKGQKQAFTVTPLPDVKGAAKPANNSEPTEADVTAATDLDTLRAMYAASGPERRAQIEARVAEINTKPTVQGPNNSATNSAPDDGPTDADWDAMGAPAGGAS